MEKFLICYDIAEPKRLGRIYRALIKSAFPLQYSVFLFKGSSTQLAALLDQLTKNINPKEDDLRAYSLPKRGVHLHLGRKQLPDGIFCG